MTSCNLKTFLDNEKIPYILMKIKVTKDSKGNPKKKKSMLIPKHSNGIRGRTINV